VNVMLMSKSGALDQIVIIDTGRFVARSQSASQKRQLVLIELVLVRVSGTWPPTGMPNIVWRSAHAAPFNLAKEVGVRRKLMAIRL
jgi:hypothetical protein